MFEKIGLMAEQVATSVSRRRFLARFGRAAAGAASVVGGFLLLPSDAHAGKRCGGRVCPPGYDFCCKEPDPIAPHNFVRVCSITPCR